MSLRKIAGIILLAGGIILLGFGINAANSPLEELGEAITGRYSDETMAYLISGAIASLLGLVLVLRGK